MNEKLDALKQKFSSLANAEEKYSYIIELGRSAPLYPPELKTPDRVVAGCQSILHLDVSLRDGKLYFLVHSDALISQGLAMLLAQIYSGETPETILLHPPLFLQELGILSSLSPHRSNGVASIYLRMRLEAGKKILAERT